MHKEYIVVDAFIVEEIFPLLFLYVLHIEINSQVLASGVL